MDKIKALLLSAGYGTRLRPLTLTTPKCLVKVNGIPLLAHWLSKLEKLGCDEVLINTHYLANKVNEFLKTYKSQSMKIIISYEKDILGTAGSLLKHIDFFRNSTGLLIHADNFTNDSLNEFVNQHNRRPKDCLMTMLTFNTDNPSSCGIVSKDVEGRIIDFFEKSKESHGDCANGAIYAFDNEFISFLKTLPKDISDFSTDIIPLIIRKIFSWHTSEFFIDIGNESSLKKANLFDLQNKMSDIKLLEINNESNQVNEAKAFDAFASNYIKKLSLCFNSQMNNKIYELAESLKEAWQNGKNIFLCGNGGSGGNAIHIANDFIYGTGACGKGEKIPGLKVNALSSNPAILTCLANDTGFENIYSYQLEVQANKDDILIVLSGSGNSENIVSAINTANKKGLKTFGILAFDGGKCKKILKHPLHFEINDMQIAEDIQLIIGHLCMQWLSANKPIF